MSFKEKMFSYVVKHWYLKDCVIYSKRTGRAVSFPGVGNGGYLYTNVRFDGGCYKIQQHIAIYMLHHNRPVSDHKDIHHIDGNPRNNAPENLVELTRRQHMRIHAYQCDDPLRGIRFVGNVWRFSWNDNDGIGHSRDFHGINEAMKFRAEIEEPYRAELRALGLDC
ncbi:HNH endonuclease [Escherichia coli]|nr:HNH endonuclease [Escherichia coli]